VWQTGLRSVQGVVTGAQNFPKLPKFAWLCVVIYHMKVKFGVVEDVMGSLEHAKFDLDRRRGCMPWSSQFCQSCSISAGFSP